MTVDSDRDVLEVLLGRRAFVEVLAERGLEKPALAEELDVSRSTVDRALRDLQVADLVTRTGAGYTTTPFGTIALAHVEDVLSDLEDVDRTAPLLGELPAELPMSIEFLRGASIHLVGGQPDRETVDRIIERLEGTARCRTLVHMLTITDTPHYIENRVKSGDLRMEVVAGETLLPYLQGAMGERTRDLLRTGRYELWVTSSVPYGLTIGERHDGTSYAWLFVDHDRRELAGIIETEHPPAIEWATELFESVRDDAERVRAEDLTSGG